MVIALLLLVTAVAAVVAGWVGWRWPSGPQLAEWRIRRELRLHPRLAEVLRRRLDPSVATGLALTAAVLVGVVAATAVGVLLAMVRAGAGLEPSDRDLAEWAATTVGPATAELLRQLSRLGGTEGVVLVAVATCLAQLHRTPTWALPAFLVLSVGGQFALVNLMKLAVDRARPDLAPLTGFAGTSFPSGHAAAAACCYAACALVVGRRRPGWVRAALTGLAGAVAVAVAGTRVLLGVHWMTDVLAGLVVGWAWFALCSIAFGGSALRFGRPAAVAEDQAELLVPPRGG